MHVHERNPWRTLIAVLVFIVIIVIGFITMHQPFLTSKLDLKQSLSDVNDPEACFYPWQLDSFINKQLPNVVLFDIRDKFTFGQGSIPGAESLSANELTRKENIERLEAMKEKGITVVLYGEDQLQANGPWMFFRQVGFDNVKVLVGGYQYYSQHKNELAASKSDTTFQKEVPRYDFAEMAAPKDGSVISATTEKKPVEVRRRKKTAVVAGGC